MNDPKSESVEISRLSQLLVGAALLFFSVLALLVSWVLNPHDPMNCGSGMNGYGYCYTESSGDGAIAAIFFLLGLGGLIFSVLLLLSKPMQKQDSARESD